MGDKGDPVVYLDDFLDYLKEEGVDVEQLRIVEVDDDIDELKVGKLLLTYLDDQQYNEDNVQIERIYHYYDSPITYSSRDIETGQLYFNNLVDLIDGRDLHMIVPITEDLLQQLNESKLSINELYRQVGDRVIYYVLSGHNFIQYYQSHEDSLGVPDEYYNTSEDCFITDEDDFNLY